MSSRRYERAQEREERPSERQTKAAAANKCENRGGTRDLVPTASEGRTESGGPDQAAAAAATVRPSYLGPPF